MGLNYTKEERIKILDELKETKSDSFTLLGLRIDLLRRGALTDEQILLAEKILAEWNQKRPPENPWLRKLLEEENAKLSRRDGGGIETNKKPGAEGNG